MWKCPTRSVVIEKLRRRRSETMVVVAPAWMIFKTVLRTAVITAVNFEMRVAARPMSSRVQ
jgi:hypothetical protein